MPTTADRVAGDRSANVFDARLVSSASTGLVTLPSYLTITGATAGRSIRTGPSTVVSALGANAARARRTNSAGFALAVEKAMTQFEKNTNDFTAASWNKDGMTVDAGAVTLPDGTSVSGKNQLNLTGCAGADGPYQTTAMGAVSYCLSVWMQQAGGACTFKITDSVTGTQQESAVLNTVWTQYVHVRNVSFGDPTGAGIWILKTSGNALGQVAFPQAENGLYPTSFFPNTGTSPTTRAQDLLVHNTPSILAPNGFFPGLDISVVPHYASTEYIADHNLVYFGANDRIFLRQADNKVVLRLGGADIVSTALTFAREDEIRVRAQHTAAGRRLFVWLNGGKIYDSTLQSAGAAITLPGSVGLLSDGTTTVESAGLRRLAA